MSPPLLNKALIYQTMDREVFACLSYLTPAGEPRSVGICYVVDGERLIIATERDSWKARYIAADPRVALTIPIAKRIPFLPWIRIPSATISFPGTVRTLDVTALREPVYRRLLRVNAAKPEELATCCVLEVTPTGYFTTYGVGVSLLGMRDHRNAGGRIPVGAPA